MAPSGCTTTKLQYVHSVQTTGCGIHAVRMLQSLLDDIRAQRIPVDFLELFDTAKLPFYDGKLAARVTATA